MHRVRSLVTVLALGIPTLAAAQPAAKKLDPVSTFLKQDKYTYCDVKILSALWKGSIQDAKARVGVKLQNNSTAAIDGELVAARKNAQTNRAARCTFAEAGFSYNDAVKLGKMIQQKPPQAKAWAENKILAGNEAIIRDMLKVPAAQATATMSFTYCDYKVLAARWKKSTSAAKARVATKLRAQSEAYLKTELEAGRQASTKNRVRCSYKETGLTFNDVQKLAKLWSTTTADVKGQIERKAPEYGVEFFREALALPGTESASDMNAFLRQSKYTYCDAKIIAGLWKESLLQAKTFIGLKLNSNNTAAIDSALVEARAFATKNPAARCTFSEAGFTAYDAQVLAGRWNKTDAQVRATVEQKILAGKEAYVRSLLKPIPPPPNPGGTRPKPPPNPPAPPSKPGF